jgi:hypothetical protein
MTHRPKVELLRPTDVRVDAVVQRSLDKNWIDRLVKNWDDEKFGTVEISRRDDGDYVTDGQHRLAALIELGRGDEKFPMLVVPSAGREDEAKRFVARNAENRRPNPVDIYRVQYVAGDVDVIEIDKVLTKYGLHVELGQGPHFISAVAALRFIHRQGGTDLLDRVISIIDSAYHGESGAYNGALMKGLSLILTKRGDEVDVTELADKLSRNITPARLLGKSRVVAETWRKSLPNAAADVILGIYNTSKRSRRVEL